MPNFLFLYGKLFVDAECDTAIECVFTEMPVAVAAKGLMDTVLAVNLRQDLYQRGSAFVVLSSDIHATKLATCRGTPKSMTKSASHTAVGHLFVKSPKK